MALFTRFSETKTFDNWRSTYARAPRSTREAAFAAMSEPESGSLSLMQAREKDPCDVRGPNYALFGGRV